MKKAFWDEAMNKAFWDGLAKAVLQSTPWASQYTFAEAVLEEILPDLTKKLKERFNSPDRQITEQVNTLLPASYQAQYRDYIYAAALTCFQNLSPQKLINSANYVPETIASDETAYYLEQEQVEEDYENVTKTYLPKILAPVIYNFQLDLQSDSAFMHQLIVSFSGRLTDIDERLKKVEQEQELTRTERREKTPSVQEYRQYFTDLWTAPSFLDTQKEDAKVLGEFCKIHSEEDEDDEKNVSAHLQDTLDAEKKYHKIFQRNRHRVLVILGEPGIGKSTIISYLLNTCTINRRVRVYRLNEFKDVSVNASPQTLLDQMGIEEANLNHSILILDGLDEMALQGDYVQFLNKLQKSWGNNSTLQNFSLIITCRTNRIKNVAQLESSHCKLSPLEKNEIESFAKAYLGHCPEDLTDCLKKDEELDASARARFKNDPEGLKNWKIQHPKLSDVLGIPLVLYMVLALNIPFKEVTSLAQIYDMLFTPTGAHSIYLRSRYDTSHRLTEALAPQIHEFSKQVAAKMWETDHSKAELRGNLYHQLAEEILSLAPKTDENYTEDNLFIGQYFGFSTTDDGENTICFVHRSMYEYFVALSIYDAIKAISGLSPDKLYGEMAPGTPCALTPLAELLGFHYLLVSPEIKNYLLHLMHSRKAPIQNRPAFEDAPKMVHLFVEKGLTDAAIQRPHGGERGIQEEANRFWNLIWICREMMILQGEKPPYDLLPGKLHNTDFKSCLLRIPTEVPLDCRDINLNHADLNDVDLSRAHLDRADLTDARLDGADLIEAHLISAHLNGADLIDARLDGADLIDVHLIGAHLSGADLVGADLNGADLNGADLNGADLFEAHLIGVHLIGADLNDADLNDADLTDADLTGADLTGADLTGADLTGADLTRCRLPDGELYEHALKKYGTRENVLLRFIDPDEQP